MNKRDLRKYNREYYKKHSKEIQAQRLIRLKIRYRTGEDEKLPNRISLKINGVVVKRPLDPKKAKTRAITNALIKKGELKRNPCEICGDTKADVHHNDYDNPIDIRWLCQKHHSELHRNLTNSI